MKSRLNPVHVQLKELPLEGRDFEFTNNSGELNNVLKDLIGDNPYQLKFRLVPQGNTFDLKGHLSTSLNLQCSTCAGDFKLPVELDLHEFIVIEPAMGKGDQMSRANHAHEWEAGGPDYIVLDTDELNVGEYAHEAIALAEPIRPLCGSPEKGDVCIQIGGEKVERPWLSYGDEETPETKIRPNPFEALQKLKLKS